MPRFTIETHGVEADALIEDYLRTTLHFATWWHDRPAERIHVRLDRVGASAFRCAVRARRGDGRWLLARAGARELHEAVQLAADRLEVQFCSPNGRPPVAAAGAYAA